MRMRKTMILMFWVGGLIFSVIGIYLSLQIPPDEFRAPVSLQSPIIIPIALILIASVSHLIAWIGALVAAIRFGAWGWLVALIFLSSLGMLAFLIFGPDEYGMENEYEDYGDYNDSPA